MSGSSFQPGHREALTWRREAAGDRAFLFAVYAGTRAEELDQAGWPMDVRATFLAQQFEAMTAGYATAFPEADRWVIETAGEPCAAVIVARRTDEHRVVYLAVLPGRRGHGVGTEVMKRLQTEAAAAGMPLRLQAFTGSRAATWYRRLGFVETGTNAVRLQFEWRSAPRTEVG